MEEMIINYLLQWGPSVVSVITMVCTVITAIKKVGNYNDENLKETRNLEKQLNAVATENMELKKTLNKILNKLYKIKSKEE